MKRIDRIILKHIIDGQVRAGLTASGKRLPSDNTRKRSPRAWPPLIAMPNSIVRYAMLDEFED